MQRLLCTATTLRALPFFSSLADSVIAEALPLLQVRTYAARAAISAPAALVDYVCIVLAGKVNVLQTDESGREMVLEELGEHEFFNEDACLGQRSSGERFEAETESTILFAPRRLIENCLTQDPTTAQLLLQTLARRLSRARRKIASLGLDTVYARVVDVLLQRGHDENGEWFVDVGAEFIAALVGASREMVSRVVRDLIDRGFVRRVKRQIIVSKRSVLEQYYINDRAALCISTRHSRTVEPLRPREGRLAA